MGMEWNAAIQAMMEIVDRETSDFLCERLPKIYPHYLRLIVLEDGTPAEIQETKSSLENRIVQTVKAVLLAVFGMEPDPASPPETFLQRYKHVMALYQETTPRTGLYGCLEDAPDIFQEDLSQKQKGDVLTVDNHFFQDASGKVDEKFKRGVAGCYVFKKASSKPEYPHAASIFTPDGETFLTKVENGLKGIWPIWQGDNIAGFVTLDGDGDMAIRYGDGRMEYCRIEDELEPFQDTLSPEPNGTPESEIEESQQERQENGELFIQPQSKPNEYTEQETARQSRRNRRQEIGENDPPLSSPRRVSMTSENHDLTHLSIGEGERSESTTPIEEFAAYSTQMVQELFNAFYENIPSPSSVISAFNSSDIAIKNIYSAYYTCRISLSEEKYYNRDMKDARELSAPVSIQNHLRFRLAVLLLRQFLGRFDGCFVTRRVHGRCGWRNRSFHRHDILLRYRNA